MTPIEKLSTMVCESTEPRRREIGWFSIAGGLLIAGVLAAITVQEHNLAIAERDKASLMRANVSRLEDSIRDQVNMSDRGMAIVYAGEDGPGDERLIGWAPALTELLGWTLEDIQEGGLGIIMTSHGDQYKHQTAMEAAIKKPPGQRRTAVIHCQAKRKDGVIIPVRITAWVVGDLTRSVAAYIEAESQVFEKTIVE